MSNLSRDLTETVRFENAKVFQGSGFPLLDSLTISGGFVVNGDQKPDRVVDCHGAAILPAFGDAHCHPLLAARAALGPQVSDCESVESIRVEVRVWAEANPDVDWIVGGFYDRDLAPEGRFSKLWLDDLDSRPIVLHAADQHAIWVNSAALRAAGIDNSFGTPFGVELENDQPLGTLREDAKAQLLRSVPEQSATALARGIETQLDYLASLGIVYALDAWVDEAGLRAYELVNHPVRVDTALWITPETNLSAVSETQDVKLFADGVIGSATALVRERYSCESAHPYGVSSWTRKHFDEVLTPLADGNRNVFVHAIGDAAIDWVLELSNRVSRLFIEHAELLTADQIVLAAKHNVGVCFQPLWARTDAMMQNAIRNLGADRAANMYPIAALDSAGGTFVFGSDWPVSSADPLMGIYTAVTRKLTGSDLVHNPDNRISIEKAIAAYTTGDTSTGSRSSGKTRHSRNLNVGSRADFVLLDGDPFLEVENIPSMSVVETFSGGQRIFTRH